MTAGSRAVEHAERQDAKSIETSLFDPDSRVDTNNKQASGERGFNPDARIESGDSLSNEVHNITLKENVDSMLEKAVSEYYQELIGYAAMPETMPDKFLKVSDLRRLSPEEVKTRRAEFNRTKNRLIKEWELRNGRDWPTYEKDIVIGGRVVRRAGDRYDAHHTQPLFAGGRNSAENITPIHVENHYDKKGVHAPDGACERIKSALGGDR